MKFIFLTYILRPRRGGWRRRNFAKKCLVLGNWNDWATIRWRKYDDILSRFDTIPERDRRTDGLTELLYQYCASALLCWRAMKTLLSKRVALVQVEVLLPWFSERGGCPQCISRDAILAYVKAAVITSQAAFSRNHVNELEHISG